MWPCNRFKTHLAGDIDAVLVAAGAVADKDIAAAVPANDYAYVTVSRIKNKIAGLRLAPRDRPAVVVLGDDAPALAYDIASLEMADLESFSMKTGEFAQK